ncbi:hypothetical protein F2Q69_00023663 [Brassica cretica]|uniref:Uncharacterized protein n=1 Tax=Brassica cretica TaxID=69181 RepID=A0A8S9Q9A7_BRACR|nr:hypothetical protein F2Q69_00023663 [Brassica cretica]
MVETRRGMRKKENPQGSEKKEKSAKKAKTGAMEKKTMEKSETRALEETTAVEKTSDVSAPINVLVDVVATVDARDGSELGKSDLHEARSGELEDNEANVGKEKSAASDEDNEVDEGEEKSAASDEDVEGEEKSDESGDDSAGQGDGGVGEVRQETANEEGGRPAEEAEEIEDAAGDGVHLPVQSIEQGEGMKMLKTMLRLIKRVDKKVDQLDEILLPLEAFVKDVEKQKQRKK